jgi:amino acid permease
MTVFLVWYGVVAVYSILVGNKIQQVLDRAVGWGLVSASVAILLLTGVLTLLWCVISWSWRYRC